MDFFSTRGEGPVSGARAIINGIAKDGGLYVPSSFPKITTEDLFDMADLSYSERAAYIMSLYLTEYTYEELLVFTEKAYSRFEDSDPAPLVQVDEGTFIMELWHGPTLAFKDVALTMLPHLLTSAKKKEGEENDTLILVATSGDTGKAALEGFKDVEGTEIVVLYPSEGVSDMQKLQMATTEGNNVHVVGIKGNFDDAQRAVKRIFNGDMKGVLAERGYDLSSANSINFGRLLPQIVYYISAYVDLLSNEYIEECEEINFIVPSGNFGNILAGYYAKQMGLPIKQLIVASNENNVLTEFFSSGIYDSNREFFKTISPSMDILVSSNLERLLYEVGDRKADFVRDLMERLSEDGTYSIDEDLLYDKLPEFIAYFSTEAETKEVMDNFFDEYRYVLDPHTAVAVSALFKYMSEVGDSVTPNVIVSTANPYKFPQSVYEAIAHKTEEDAFKATKKLESYSGMNAPEGIKRLIEKEVRFSTVVEVDEIDSVIANVGGNE